MAVLRASRVGPDVHKDSGVAAPRLTEPSCAGSEIRRFGTPTPGLLALGDWLATCGCIHVVTEATRVYWSRSGTPSRIVIPRWFWPTGRM
jgi:hypothetical protein